MIPNVTPVGNDRVLVAMVGCGDNLDVTTITAMKGGTRTALDDWFNFSYRYARVVGKYMIEPDEVTDDVEVSFDAGSYAFSAGFVTCLSDADQVDPMGTPVTDSDLYSGTGVMSITVPSETDEIVLDVVTVMLDNLTMDPAYQTLVASYENLNNTGSSGASYAAGDPAREMRWTYNNTGGIEESWAMGGGAVKPSAGPSGPAITVLRRRGH